MRTVEWVQKCERLLPGFPRLLDVSGLRYAVTEYYEQPLQGRCKRKTQYLSVEDRKWHALGKVLRKVER